MRRVPNTLQIHNTPSLQSPVFAQDVHHSPFLRSLRPLGHQCIGSTTSYQGRLRSLWNRQPTSSARCPGARHVSQIRPSSRCCRCRRNPQRQRLLPRRRIRRQTRLRDPNPAEQPGPPLLPSLTTSQQHRHIANLYTSSPSSTAATAPPPSPSPSSAPTSPSTTNGPPATTTPL